MLEADPGSLHRQLPRRELALKVTRAVLAVGYPFLVILALHFLSPRLVAVFIVASFLIRWVARWKVPGREPLAQLGVPAVLIGSVLAVTMLSNEERVLLCAPAAVNLALLIAFARTLRGGPTFVETLARMQVPDLPADEVRYCRTVTVVWCGFLALNGAVSIVLAFLAPRAAWAFYTGVLAYLLVGLLFASEFVVRSWRFGRYEGTLVEPLFKRIFPPPNRGSSRP